MNLAPDKLLALCKQYGPAIKNLPASIDGARLLWALSFNESSNGRNIAPRHEQGYCYGGRHFDGRATGEFGCLAHMSFGPWQIMAANAKGFTPLELLEDPEKCAQATVGMMSRIFETAGVISLGLIAKLWNGPAVPPAYVQALQHYYTLGMPGAQGANA